MASKLDISKLESYKVNELKQFLKDRNLDDKGLKAELVERLKKHEQSNQDEVDVLGDLDAVEGDDLNSNEEDLLDEDVSESVVAPVLDNKPVANPVVPSKPVASVVKPSDSPSLGASDGNVSAKQENATVSSGSSGVSSVTLGQTEKDKKQSRAERFGIPTKQTADAQKKNRAERFGIPMNKTEEQKKEERAQKFGKKLGDEKKTLNKEAIQKAKEDRAARFGIPTKKSAEEKLNKRKERFASDAQQSKSPKLSAEEDAKRKQRAERFSNNNN